MEELELALTQVGKELSKEKADWESTRQSMDSLFKKTLAAINLGKVSPGEPTYILSMSILGLVGRLGTDLTRTDDRLARVEKAVKDLRLSK